MAFVDRNRDLYFASVQGCKVNVNTNTTNASTSTSNSSSSSSSNNNATNGFIAPEKLATMVSSVAWHDVHETLVAITDGVLTTWFYPAILYVDRNLLPLTK